MEPPPTNNYPLSLHDALPISAIGTIDIAVVGTIHVAVVGTIHVAAVGTIHVAAAAVEMRAAAVEPTRSEERRVGKECRSRWSTEYSKKQKRRQRETSTQHYEE